LKLPKLMRSLLIIGRAKEVSSSRPWAPMCRQRSASLLPTFLRFM
jgi:hypothetical protein